MLSEGDDQPVQMVRRVSSEPVISSVATQDEARHGGSPKTLGKRACASDSAPTSEESALDWDISLSYGSHSKQQLREGAAGNQLTENSAAYFLWPPVCPSHGTAGERADFFKGLQKDVNFNSSCFIPTGQQASSLYELMSIRAYNSRLLRRVSLGTAVGFRTRRGVLTYIPAIIVFVAHKVDKAWLHESQMLPTYLEGPGGVWCDVDVVEFYYHGVPTFTPKEQVYTELAEGLRGNDPYIGPGSQVASQETIGTLGAIVRSRTGACQIGFLTNRHVAVDLDYPSQKMFHPLPPNVGPSVYLGAVERATSFITDEGWYDIFVSTNPETFVRADGAFVPFSDTFDMSRVTAAVKGVGEMGDASVVDLQAPIESIVGKQVTKVGRSSGLTKGTIMAYALEYNDEKGICFLTDFLIVGENQQAFDLEGDSGSLILMTEDWPRKPRPVGIIWGGTANRGRLKLRSGYGPENWTSGVDLGHLLAWLQLDLITSDTTLQEVVEAQRRLKAGVGGDFSAAPLGCVAGGGMPTTLPEGGHLLKSSEWQEQDGGADSLAFENFRGVPSNNTACVQEIDFGIQQLGKSQNMTLRQPCPLHESKSNGTDGGLDLNQRFPKRIRRRP